MLRIHPAVSMAAGAGLVGFAIQACSSSSSGGPSPVDAGSEASPHADASADTGSTPEDGGAVDSATSDASDSAPEAAAEAGVATDVIYVETNDITPGANAVVAYSRAADGSLTALPGSPFAIGGDRHRQPHPGARSGRLGPGDRRDAGPHPPFCGQRRQRHHRRPRYPPRWLVEPRRRLTVSFGRHRSGEREGVSPDGKFLYVLSQRSTTDPTLPQGNVLHGLSIGADGKLTETVPDIKLTLPLGTRPQGIVVF